MYEAQNVSFMLFNIGNVQAHNYEKDPQIGITLRRFDEIKAAQSGVGQNDKIID